MTARSTRPWHRVVTMVLVVATLSAMSCSRSGKTEAEFRPGGVWLDSMRENVEGHITDPGRASSMLAILESIELELVEIDELKQAFNAAFIELDRNYNTSREEFEENYETYAQSLYARRDHLIELAFELKGLATREEWASLAKVDVTIYESWRRKFELK